MVKKLNNTKFMLLGGVIIGVLIILTIISVNSNKNERVIENLSEDDFKIISASWDTSEAIWDAVQEAYVQSNIIPINWNYRCNNNCSNGKCIFSDYQITTQQSEDLNCNTWFDNTKYDLGNNVTGYYFKKGITSSAMWNGFDITKNHQIKICCTSFFKEGEVCQSINLLTKC